MRVPASILSRSSSRVTYIPMLWHQGSQSPFLSFSCTAAILNVLVLSYLLWRAPFQAAHAMMTMITRKRKRKRASQSPANPATVTSTSCHHSQPRQAFGNGTSPTLRFKFQFPKGGKREMRVGVSLKVGWRLMKSPVLQFCTRSSSHAHYWQSSSPLNE